MKYRIYIGITLVALLMTACKKDEEDPYLEVWKQQNEQAFNNLANNPDFTELHLQGSPGSIYYRVIQQGNGKRLYYNSRAEVYYKGWYVVGLTNGGYNFKAGDIFEHRLFDDGTPFKLAVSSIVAERNTYPQVYDGWSLALQYMVEGDKWEIWIPCQLAMGEKSDERIPSYSTLAFEIEVVRVIDPNEF